MNSHHDREITEAREFHGLRVVTRQEINKRYHKAEPKSDPKPPSVEDAFDRSPC